eukprot:9503837-Pyramimonas_sp.AAC.2
MRQWGDEPDPATYASLIRMCEQRGEVYEALELYEEMKSTGLVPDSDTYNALLMACERANLRKEGMALYKEIAQTREDA